MSNSYLVEIINDVQAISAGLTPAIYIGPIGPTGLTPVLTIGTVEFGDNPSATITGTAENPVLNLVLPRGLQGVQGIQGEIGPEGPRGVGVQSFEHTGGTGMPGTHDTYTITLTSGETATITVYNGKDGTGAGDMVMGIYDPDGDGKVSAADDADRLGGVAAIDYAKKTDLPSVPSVPEWALAAEKPTYTATDVGALPATGQASDSAKLGGQTPDHYAPASALAAKADIPQILTITLKGGAANWPGNMQTMDAPGVIVGDGQTGTPIPVDEDAYNDAGIKLLVATAANKAAFACETVPSADMVVRLVLTGVKPV